MGDDKDKCAITFGSSSISADCSEEEKVQEILRIAMQAELDAISLYEKMAGMVKDENAKAVLLDVANDEKTHVGEFQALLLGTDIEHGKELERGKQEVINIIKEKREKEQQKKAKEQQRIQEEMELLASRKK